jgi:hypothetical protein
MTIEAEEPGKRGGRIWKLFFAGFLSGVVASLLVLVGLAFKYAPRHENVAVDLYSGHTKTYSSFLWKHSETLGPVFPHVQWAIEHQDQVRSWYMLASGTQRAGWFERVLEVTYSGRDFVYGIYRLELPEEEKIKLLHQYHEGLDALKMREYELFGSERLMERFCVEWAQRLEKAAQDAQLAAPPE